MRFEKGDFNVEEPFLEEVDVIYDFAEDKV